MVQIKMIRVYETVFEFDTDNEQEAILQFEDIPDDEKYATELEQCYISEAEVLLPGEKVLFDPFEN
jgi:hypothetical protein